MSRRSHPIPIPGILIQEVAQDGHNNDLDLTSRARSRSRSPEGCLLNDDEVFLEPSTLGRIPAKLSPDWDKENAVPPGQEIRRKTSAKRKCQSSPPETLGIKNTRMTLYPSVSNSPR